MCPFCQSPNPPGALHCRTCGSPLKGLSDASPSSSNDVLSRSNTSQAQSIQPTSSRIASDEAHSPHTSTHAGGNGAQTAAQDRHSPFDAAQDRHSPFDIAARAALFPASTIPAAPPSTPVLQATWRDCKPPIRAIAFWPAQTNALENPSDDASKTAESAHQAIARDALASETRYASAQEGDVFSGDAFARDLIALCDESGAFQLRDGQDAANADGAANADRATERPSRSLFSSRLAQASLAQARSQARLAQARSFNGRSALCAALSPGNRLFAVGQEDGTIQVKADCGSRRDSRQNQVVFKAHEGAVKVLAWNGGAALLASGGADGVVRLWDIENPKRRQILCESEHLITALAWSQDGHWLAAGNDLGAVSVWNVRGVGNEVLGARHASGARDGVGQSEIRVAELAWTKTRHEFWISALCFTPNGLALASGGYDGTARVWSCDNGFELQLLEGHSGVAAAAFAHDNRTLCCGGSDGALNLWDSWTGNALHALPPLSQGVRALAFAPRASDSPEAAPTIDGRRETLAAATAREVQIWRW
jgi:hypothetical protein